MTSLMQR